MADESIYVKLQNYLLPLLLLQSPWLKENVLTVKPIAFLCSIAIISYKGLDQITSRIFGQNDTSIPEVLLFSYRIFSILVSPFICFYYRFWKRRDSLKFGESQKTIDNILRITNLPLPKIQITTVIVLLLLSTQKLFVCVLLILDHRTVSSVLLLVQELFKIGLMFQCVTSKFTIKTRYT